MSSSNLRSSQTAGDRVHRASIATTLLLALSLPAATAADVSIGVDASDIRQTMDGFGSSQRMFDDPHTFNNFNATTRRAATVMTRGQEDQILDLLYRDLKLTRMRTAIDVPGYEPVNDNADPNVADLSKFDFSWKGSDGYIDLVKRAQGRGLRTPFRHGMWERWMNESNPAELAEYVMVTLLHWRDAGVTLEYYSLLNEPGYSVGAAEDPKRTVTGEYMRDVIKILGPRMRAAGLATMLVVSDDIGPAAAEMRSRIILSDPGARPYVGALATHLYYFGYDCSGLQALGRQYGLPVWMTEFFSGVGGLQSDWLGWAGLMHDQMWMYDVSAIDYMFGFFGAWTNGTDKLIALNTSGETYTGYTLSREYYVTGQWSRFVPQGAKRIGSTTSDASIKATAFKDAQNIVVVAVNANSSATKSIRVALSGVSGMSDARPTRTSATDSWAVLPAITFAGSAFDAVLPPRSVTTYVISGGTPSNQAPVARGTASPGSGTAPVSVTFDGSNSTDADGTIASFSWNFGDGTSGSGASVNHVYATAGTYAAVLRVTDNLGASSTITLTISVTVPPAGNQPPVARVSATPTSGIAPVSVGFDGSASTDADGTISSYAWSFGDGTTGTGSSVNHVYAASGSYDVRMIVTDNSGATSSETITITVSDPTPPTPGTGPIARWTFDEGSGQSAADSTGNGHTGTLVSDVAWTSGTSGPALAFNGANGQVSVPDFDPPTDLTVEAWIRPGHGSGVDRMIVNKHNSEYDLRIDDNGNLAGEVGNVRLIASGFDFGGSGNAGRWYHVAYTFDASANVHKLYRDGVEVASGVNTASIANQATELRIGRHSQFDFGTFLGDIDDVRLYDRALDAAEVRADARQEVVVHGAIGGGALSEQSGAGSRGCGMGSGSALLVLALGFAAGVRRRCRSMSGDA
ncbi:MAG: PKD domain-containing protein [Planctomycetes bacterium]|nr:PKD domain-containing protein [Planctomycetota bacterium]